MIIYEHVNEYSYVCLEEHMIEENKNVGNAKAKKEIVKRVQSTKPSMEQMEQLADLFKVFGDSTRIKIIYTLIQGRSIPTPFLKAT